jgi:hypothetical protein
MLPSLNTTWRHVSDETNARVSVDKVCDAFGGLDNALANRFLVVRLQ